MFDELVEALQAAFEIAIAQTHEYLWAVRSL